MWEGFIYLEHGYLLSNIDILYRRYGCIDVGRVFISRTWIFVIKHGYFI